MAESKDNSEDFFNLSPQPKRRGRPRKNNQIVEKTTKKTKAPSQNSDTPNEEEIILRLPITLKDLGLKKKDTGDKSSSPPNTNIFTITDMSYDSSPSSEEFSIKNFKELTTKLKELETENLTLKEELKKWRSSKSKIEEGDLENKVVKMDIDYIDHETGKQIVVEKTNIECWWCRHTFETMPCFIPEKCVNGTYYVWGNFCSYNCATAYNFDVDDYKTWNRYCLIKKLYNKIYSNFDEVPVAGTWQSLKKCGGSKTIEEFRQNAKTNLKEYRFVMPPMACVVPMIEESCTDHHIRNMHVKNMNSNLILKRNKPLPSSKNTLIESMGIIRKKKSSS